MSNHVATCKCCNCHKDVTFHYEQQISHLRHFWLTLFTLGLWFPIWFMEIFARVKICDVCGKPTKE